MSSPSTISRLFGTLLTLLMMTACAASTPAETEVGAAPEASAVPATPTEVPVTETPVPTETAVPPTETAEPAASPIPPTAAAEPTATTPPTATALPPLSGSGGGVIAYVSQPEDAAGIQIMNADGSDQRRLTDSLDSHPTWSPDGSKIAFDSRSGTAEDGWGIYGIDLATGEVTLFVKNDVDPLAPDWSPDGKRFALTNSLEINLTIPGSSRLVNIPPPGNTNPENLFADHPDWSPDGSKLVYTVANMIDTFKADIFSADANGSNIVQLTFDEGDDRSPVWSPDGSLIAFESDREGGWDIYLMNADGSDSQNITNSPDSRELWPSWSPDGSKIAFQTDRDGSWEIYVMNADGTQSQRLTDNEIKDIEPAWRP